MDERPACLICGGRFLSIGHHVGRAHDVSIKEYRDRFGIRRGASLTAPSTRERMSSGIQATIAAGALDDHFASNAARAGHAAKAGAAVKRDLRAAGIDLPHGTPETPRTIIEQIVAAIEGGAKVATAVKRSPIAYSTFHEGLGRHSDLKGRVIATKRRP